MMHHPIIVCHPANRPLFPVIHGFCGISHGSVPAVFDLNKNSIFAVSANDINLTPAVSVIVLQYFHALSLQIFYGSLLVLSTFFLVFISFPMPYCFLELF